MQTHTEVIKIEVEVEDGYEAKWNSDTKQINFIKRIELPMSWEEFLQIKASKQETKIPFRRNYDELENDEEIYAFTNLGRLIQLRDEWWKTLNWKPNWADSNQVKWTIHSYGGKVIKGDAFATRYNFILAFPTEKIRDKFYEAFRMEIESAYLFL